jgi:isoleucyl-tRNA synthetase
MNPNPQNLSTKLEVKSPNAEQEEKLLQFWRDQNIFNKTLEKNSPASPEATQGEKDFVFFEGPPTANGRPGIHHVAARSFKDIIPRYKTMRGFSVRRKAGWDTHGLPVELQVEKALGLKSKKEIEAYGIAEFNKQCKESVWLYKDEWEKLTARMGFWLDMKSPYVTYENSYIEALWGIVKKVNERGHLYKDFRVGPWCARCGTTLSSHELNQPGAYKDIKDLSVFAKFPIIGFDKAYFLAWTTTPWTLPGNVALAVGADIDYVEAKVGDEIYVVAKDLTKILPEGYEIIAEHKGSEMVGMKYEPLYPYLKDLMSGSPSYQEGARGSLEKAYQVYTADFVTTTDGTGIVHTAVMYGADDFELGTKLGLPKFHTVTEEGKFIPGTDFLEGRFVKEKNDKGEETVAIDIIKDLAGRGLLFKKEKYEHSYPHCWRCDTPLIYYARTSWYFAMSKLRQQLLDANKEINWEPDHIKEGRFGEWLDGIKDWAISRDRYWGTPLPVWSTTSGKNVVIGGLADLKKYAKKSGNKYFVMRHGQAGTNITHTWDFVGDPNNHLTDEGKNQVRTSAEFLKDKNIDVVIYSPILRTTETAQLVAETIGFSGSLISDDRLVEFQAGGDWQGKPTKDFIAQFENYPNRFTKEGLPGENYRDVKKRVMDVLYDLENKYVGKNILIVSHGSPVLNMIIGTQGMLEKDTPDNIEEVAYPKNAEIRELDFVPLPHNENYELDFHKPYIDAVELELDGPTSSAGKEKLTRTPEVMDVWFDSGSMPMAQDHKLGEEMNFDPRPADYIAEGVDQTRGWFYLMHAIANLLHDEPTAAYKNVICMGLLMDEKGQKMSKSRGNVVDPWAMFDKYGADVVRFWFYSVNQPGESKNFDEKLLDEANKKVFNILRNIVSFYDMYAGESVDADPYTSTNVLDQWILALWNKTLGTVVAGLDKYQPLEPARALRDFIGEFSTWYIRRSRDRFKSDDVADRGFALATTKYILQEIAKTMAPFTPFIAEEIWQKFGNSESVHLEMYPVAKSFDQEIITKMAALRDIVSKGLELRNKLGIKVRQPLALFKVKSMDLNPEHYWIILDELNIKGMEVDTSIEEDVWFDTEITEELKNEGDMRELSRAIQEMRKNANLMPQDRVVVSLTETEPDWFASVLGDEMMRAVGAEKIVWGSEVKVEKIG